TSSTSMDIHHEDTLVISDDDMDDLSQSIVIIPKTQPRPRVRSEAERAARRAQKRAPRIRRMDAGELNAWLLWLSRVLE
ncbi:hypothetical protein BGX30_003656, partial [Mortierella sp. GBA39]